MICNCGKRIEKLDKTKPYSVLYQKCDKCKSNVSEVKFEE